MGVSHYHPPIIKCCCSSEHAHRNYTDNVDYNNDYNNDYNYTTIIITSYYI